MGGNVSECLYADASVTAFARMKDEIKKLRRSVWQTDVLSLSSLQVR